jgi:hypothetical protein
MSDEDLAFETLQSVRATLAADLPEELVSACYAIQKKHQFDQDRSLSAKAMERLIDEYVDMLLSESTSAGESE